jgi:hypothetical protein
VGSSLELLEGAANRFLLCSVLAKRTRRLWRLIPEMRVAELIGVARRNFAEHTVQVYIDGKVPDVIREQAAAMFPLPELSATLVGIGDAAWRRSLTANGTSTFDEQQRSEEAASEEERSHPPGNRADAHVSVGTGFGSVDSYRNLSGFEGKWSMSHTNGTDKMRQLQLQALAQNLYTLANRHRENRNFVVAHALYGRALEMARGLDIPQHSDNGSALIQKIEKDQRAVFEILRSGELGSPSAPQEKVQKAGQ